jgi:hypothetical protein
MPCVLAGEQEREERNCFVSPFFFSLSIYLPPAAAGQPKTPSKVFAWI